MGIVIANSAASYRDPGNSNFSTLAAGQTWTGDWVDLSSFAQIITSLKSTQVGTYTFEFSSDGSTVDRSNGPYSLSANSDQPQTLACVRKYFRLKYTNTSGSLAALSIETQLSRDVQSVKSRLYDTPNQNASADTARAMVWGRTEGGGVLRPAAIDENHIEVKVASPVGAFGDVATFHAVPVIQNQQYQLVGFNERLHRRYLLGSGTLQGGTGSTKTQLIASTGASANSVATGGSLRRIAYRAGQGIITAMTAQFDTPTAGCVMWAGLGDARDGLAVGANGTQVGLRHWRFGQFEIRRLEITTAATGAETATITVNGVATNVSLVNAALNKNITANAIAASTGFATSGKGWDVYSYASGASVYVMFVSRTAEPLSGAYSFSSTGAATGTFTQITAGLVPTETWIPQAQWSDDVLDGSSSPDNPNDDNPSGFTLDATDLGIYKMQFQYLGAGNLRFYVENAGNGQFVQSHMVQRAGLFSDTSFGNMSLPMTIYADNGATTNNVSVGSASMYAANEGVRLLSGPEAQAFNSRGSIGATETAVLILQNPLVCPNGEPNTAPIVVTKYELTNTGGNQQAVWRLVKGVTLGSGATALASFVQEKPTSALLVDRTFTTGATGGDRIGGAYQPSNITTVREFEEHSIDQGYIYPGETLAFLVSTAGSNITASVTADTTWLV